MSEEMQESLAPRPPSISTEQLHIGSTLITVTDDEFCNGYTAGYLTYHVHYRNKILTEAEVYEFIMQHRQDMRTSDRWNAGLVLGWAARMHEKKQVPSSSEA